MGKAPKSLRQLNDQAKDRKSAKEKIEVDERSDKSVLFGQSYRIKTPDQLLARAKIDLDQWEVERKVVNNWEMGAKLPDGTITVAPLFQIKLWLRRRNWRERAILGAIRDIYKTAPKYPKVRHRKTDGQHLLEVSCPDLHIGKLAWALETGQNYDADIAIQSFKDAIASLASRASTFKVDRILFPIGNDYLNTDDGQSTTSGTLQDEDGRWQKTFKQGLEAAFWGIDYLQQIAPVEVLIVPGNHDRQRMFYIGEVLSAHYRSCKQVLVRNDPGQRHYVVWGKCLIGFTHGCEEVRKGLPLLMADEQRAAWGQSEWCAWHLGHFHRRFKVEFPVVDSARSVTVEIIPSLAGTDAYHHAKGYGGCRAAKAFVWSKDDGCVGEFVHHLRDRPVEVG